MIECTRLFCANVNVCTCDEHSNLLILLICLQPEKNNQNQQIASLTFVSMTTPIHIIERFFMNTCLDYTVPLSSSRTGTCV